jgi:hypothetical protein
MNEVTINSKLANIHNRISSFPMVNSKNKYFFNNVSVALAELPSHSSNSG